MEKLDTGLPLDWHPDGTPIFNRSDLIRGPRTIEPDNGIIYDNLMLPEHRHLRPEIRFNMIIIPPDGKDNLDRKANYVYLGKSYPDQKRSFIFGRVIQGYDASCRVILQRWEKVGYVTDFVVLTLQPMQLAIVPPTYECILASASSKEPSRFFEIQAWDEVRNIETIKELNGPGYDLYCNGKIVPNSNYNELSIPRIHPGHDSFNFMKRRPLYEMLTSYPKGFDFINPPRDEFFAGAV